MSNVITALENLRQYIKCNMTDVAVTIDQDV